MNGAVRTVVTSERQAIADAIACVSAGLMNDVEDVNQYALGISAGTAIRARIDEGRRLRGTGQLHDAEENKGGAERESADSLWVRCMAR